MVEEGDVEEEEEEIKEGEEELDEMVEEGMGRQEKRRTQFQELYNGHQQELK